MSKWRFTVVVVCPHSDVFFFLFSFFLSTFRSVTSTTWTGRCCIKGYICTTSCVALVDEMKSCKTPFINTMRLGQFVISISVAAAGCSYVAISRLLCTYVRAAPSPPNGWTIRHYINSVIISNYYSLRDKSFVVCCWIQLLYTERHLIYQIYCIWK